MRLAFEDRAVFENLKIVRCEGCACGGDVHDGLGGAGSRGAFRGAGAFHDAVVGNAGLGEERAGEIHIFGCNAQAAAMALIERGADVVEIGHRRNVDPGLRHGDDDVGESESELLHQGDAAIRSFGLADQIFARDAQMHVAGKQRRRDLGSGEHHHVDIRHAIDGGAVAARAGGLAHGEAGVGEIGLRLLLQAAFRRHGEDQLAAHRFAFPCAATAASTRSVRMAQPMAGMCFFAPSCSISVS